MIATPSIQTCVGERTKCCTNNKADTSTTTVSDHDHCGRTSPLPSSSASALEETSQHSARPVRRRSSLSSGRCCCCQTTEELEYREERRRRRTSLSFSMEPTQIKEIPRYDQHSKPELFYNEAELNMMRCEANMRQAGMDPAAFDWKSFR
ncbi:hypothetical protein IV203_012572 [Nitzschia inconspicua]|uniref:Uncharacterized protein n=1 Tax=Nitzschia inconspicua TaxID=303405 RepID=A0A9K3PJW1_9STRA|nr:hypothetical protein IV203_012572 [Nitzschia inconspicua]